MSSRRRLRRRACSGKVRHETMGQALAAIAYLRKSGHYDGAPLDVYRCGFCKGYHFGHRPAFIGQVIEARREGIR